MAMNFFEYQEKARKKTHLLVIYFVVAVLLIIVATNLAVGIVLLVANGSHRAQIPQSMMLQVFAIITGATLLVICTGTLYRMGSLWSGGRAVAELMGARAVMPETQEANERKLINVVQEMSIASGVPMPAVYVMENERGINAFAAGFSSSNASVTVTRGCMEILSRDELQGVIGHEFSHILNGDMLLNVRLLGLLYGILLMSLIGSITMRIAGDSSTTRSRVRVKSEGNGTMVFFLLGLALWIVGSVGLLFARLIQAAVSRQREFLADASSVQFTRNPDGLAGALKKIGGSGMRSVVENDHAQEVAHMFFASAILDMSEVFATHPPLEQRIRRIQPDWDGKYLVPEGVATELEQYAAPERPPRADATAMQLAAGDVLRHVGQSSPEHLKYAEAAIEQIPMQLRMAARDPYSARAIVLAMTMACSAAPVANFIGLIGQRLDATVAKMTQQMVQPITQLGASGWMPLLNLCLPALRTMTPVQAQQFLVVLREIIDADGVVNVHEYAISKIVRKAMSREVVRGFKYAAINPLLGQAVVMLAALARANEDVASATMAFKTGWSRLSDEVPPGLPSVTPGQLDAALDEIAQASPAVKQRFIDAAAHAVACDGVIEIEEAELLRAICAALECPLPPLVVGSGVGVGSV